MNQGKVLTEPTYCHPQHTGPNGNARKHGWNGKLRERSPEGVRHYDCPEVTGQNIRFFVAREPNVGGDPAGDGKFSKGVKVTKGTYLQN